LNSCAPGGAQEWFGREGILPSENCGTPTVPRRGLYATLRQTSVPLWPRPPPSITWNRDLRSVPSMA